MNTTILAMTGQLPEGFGKLGAIVLSFLFLYFILYPTTKSVFSPIQPDDWDLVNLGMIKKRPKFVDPPTVKKVETKQPNQDKSPATNELYDDCFKSLIGFGCSRREAKEKTESIFANNKIGSVQDFIYAAFKK